LNITTEDVRVQELLTSLLTYKNIKLTHMGHSQYKCGDKFFVIFHQPLTIEYSFASDAKGNPHIMNGVLEKIRKGDILLSPYTLWKIQLVGTFTRLRNSDVARLYGKVALSLGGRGQYIKLSNAICKQKSLESFYELDKLTTANSQKNY
jgi:hypothetical protein